jgi:tetratricopeptide (TPR) repeat protein
MIQRIEQDKSLRSDVRLKAVEMAKQAEEDPVRLNELCWGVVAKPHAAAMEYSLAVKQAEAACRLQPDAGFYLNALGVAQYRVGKYQDALATLKRSDKFKASGNQDRQPADVAFLAMAHFKLGQKANAKPLLDELRTLMKKSNWAKNAEAQALLKEAEALLTTKP